MKISRKKRKSFRNNQNRELQKENLLMKEKDRKVTFADELNYYMNNDHMYDSCPLNRGFYPIGSILLNNYYTIDKYQRYLATNGSWQNHFDNGTQNKWIPKLRRTRRTHDSLIHLKAERLVGFYVVYKEGSHNGFYRYGVVDGHNRLESVSLRLAVWLVKANQLIKFARKNGITSKYYYNISARIHSGRRMLKRKDHQGFLHYVIKLPDGDDKKQRDLNKDYYTIINRKYLAVDNNNRVKVPHELKKNLKKGLAFKAKDRLISSLNAIRSNVNKLCNYYHNIDDKFRALNEYFDVNTKISGMRPFTAGGYGDVNKNRQEAINWYNVNNGDSCQSTIQAKVRALIIQLSPRGSISDGRAKKWMMFVDDLNDNTDIIKQVLMDYYYASGQNNLKRSEIDNYTSTFLRKTFANDNNYGTHGISNFLNTILPLGKVYNFIASLEKGHLVENPFKTPFDHKHSSSDHKHSNSNRKRFNSIRANLNEHLKETAMRLGLFARTTVIPICFGLYHNGCNSLQLLNVLKSALKCEERYQIGNGSRTHYGDASDKGTFGSGISTTVRLAWGLNSNTDDLVKLVQERMFSENYESKKSFKNDVATYHVTFNSKSAKHRMQTFIDDADSYYYQRWQWHNYHKYYSIILSHLIYQPLKNNSKVRCIKLSPFEPWRLYNMALIYVSDNKFSKLKKIFHKYSNYSLDQLSKRSNGNTYNYYDFLCSELRTLQINDPLIYFINKYRKNNTKKPVIQLVLKKRLDEIFGEYFNQYTRNDNDYIEFCRTTLPDGMTKKYGIDMIPRTYDRFIIMCMKNSSKRKDQIQNLLYKDFELDTAYMLIKLGYKDVKHTRWSKDDGADVIAHHGGKTIAFQCKHDTNRSDGQSITDLSEWMSKHNRFAIPVIVISNDHPGIKLKKASSNDKNSKRVHFVLWTLKDFCQKLNQIIKKLKHQLKYRQIGVNKVIKASKRNCYHSKFHKVK